MKPYLEVEQDRVKPHKFTNKNTVHRSSLMVHLIEGANTSISFLNHFLLMINYKDTKKQNDEKGLNFYWYTAESSRQDLTGFSFHYNNISGDGSGGHSF